MIGAGMLIFAFALLVVDARIAYPTVPAMGMTHSPIVPSDATGTFATNPTEYSWTIAPVDEHIPIILATFDKGGYQLRTASGNLIVVPFTADNLFAMKFAVADDGGTYFVNAGGAPELYLPRHGSLQNATMHDARWQPFNADFTPEIPVYAGMAPDWSSFASMSWYRGMRCVGSFWTDTKFRPGGLVIPAVGLTYDVAGRTLAGWQTYSDWARAHPSPYRTAFADPDLYRRVDATQRLYAHRRE